jgi:uncharacterized surface protein with fasciclin (FAS1) repeats
MNNTVMWVVIVIAVLFGGYALWSSNNKSPVTQNTENVATTTSAETNSSVTVGSSNRKGFTSSVIAGLADAGSFAALLSASGVDATLKGKGPYTVFVPINAAFDHAAPGALNVTGDERRQLVRYHIIEGKKIDPAALTSGVETALSGDQLNLQISPLDHVARVNGALILSAYTTSNGVVYLINNVLIPPEKQVYQ